MSRAATISLIRNLTRARFRLSISTFCYLYVLTYTNAHLSENTPTKLRSSILTIESVTYLLRSIIMDCFSYDRDTFFVEVGGHNRHRRATVYEIQELLHPSISKPIKDPAGHWYEAQCIHYGLRPSKTKSVAKTRLLDALNGKTLKVPENIQMTEEKLRKKWHKDAKEKLVTQKGANVSSNEEASVRKRKAPASPEVESPKRNKIGVKKEENQESLGFKSIYPARPKRAIQSARRGQASPARAGGQTSATASKNGDNVNIHISTDMLWHGTFPSKDSSDRSRWPKQTARCNRGGSASTNKAKPNVEAKKAQEENQSPPQRRKQTARRGIPFSGRMRGNTASARGRGGTSCSQTGQRVERSHRSKQTARRSRGWRLRAGCASGRDWVPSRFESAGHATYPNVGYGSHECFESEGYENEEYFDDYDSYMKNSNGVYMDGGCSDEGYCNPENTYEGSWNEDYGMEVSVPVKEEEESDHYGNMVVF